MLVSSMENDSGSLLRSVEVHCIVSVVFAVRLSVLIVIVACAKDARARTAALSEGGEGEKQSTTDGLLLLTTLWQERTWSSFLVGSG